MMVETPPSGSIIEFKWGEKRGVGGKRREVQFYNSFLYDGIWYSLYDSVFLYKEGEVEPYVGKVIKMWEHPNKAKKVKILWFFSPHEISNYLGGTEVLPNELFIAVGEGVGLANVNPLSDCPEKEYSFQYFARAHLHSLLTGINFFKDWLNTYFLIDSCHHQEAIAGKCNIVCISKDKRNPQPSNEEVEMADFVFYRVFDVGQCKIKEAIDDKIAGIEAKYLFNRVESGHSNMIPSDKEDKKDSASHSFASDGSVPLMVKNTSIVKEHVKVQQEPLDVLRENKNISIEVHPDGKTNFGNEVSNDSSKVDRTVRLVDHSEDDGRPLKTAKLGNSELSKDVDEAKNIRGFNQKKASTGIINAYEDKNKKMHHGESLARYKGLLRKLSNIKSPRLSNGPFSNIDDKTHRDLAKIPPRLEIDKSKWFKELPWEERLQTAHELGTLVLLQNLDPSYTSAEVEDTVRRGFNEGCSARMIQQSASSVPHSGEAFVILKTRESAERVVRKLDTGCLLLPNGRPLIGSFGNPCFGEKQSNFAGHLSINDPRLRLNHETREAVATSHCSQPNTLEYDLAMEWRLQQQRSKLAWEKLVKRQEQELRQLRTTLKPK